MNGVCILCVIPIHLVCVIWKWTLGGERLAWLAGSSLSLSVPRSNLVINKCVLSE